MKRNWLKRTIAAIGIMTCMGGLFPSTATALTDEEILLLLTDPLDLRLLQSATPPSNAAIVSALNPSQDRLSSPSLWWAQDQFGDKLLSNWVAYPGGNGSLRRVDLLVNQQIWSIRTYLERYAFITQMGTAARDFGYSIRVFSQQQELLGAYICNFDERSTVSSEIPVCNVFLDPSGQGGLVGRGANPFGAFPTTGGGTPQQ